MNETQRQHRVAVKCSRRTLAWRTIRKEILLHSARQRRSKTLLRTVTAQVDIEKGQGAAALHLHKLWHVEMSVL
jgi:hypothetical protein